MIAEQVTERTYVNTTGEGCGNFGAISLPDYAVAIDAIMYPFATKERIEAKTGKRENK